MPVHKDAPRCVYCNRLIDYIKYRTERCEDSPSKMHETEKLVKE